MKDLNLEAIDKNMRIEKTIKKPDLKLYDVREEPFEIYGFFEPRSEPVFKRLPDKIGNSEAVNKNVRALYRNSAGGRVRFSTNSPYIAIRAEMSGVGKMPHMTLAGSAGFDLYIDSPDGNQSVYCRTFMPPRDMTDGYESVIDINDGGMRHYTINFPLYSNVDRLYVGVAEGSVVEKGAPYKDLKPIVYYGTSITQGGCASRPGNAYQSMIARELNINFLNLGFSDGGRGEQVMADYIADLPMSAFVCDYNTNVSAEQLDATFLNFYKTVRVKQLDVPYIMVGRPDSRRSFPSFDVKKKMAAAKRIMVDVYNYAIENGDENVYYIDGDGLFLGSLEDSCTVDGCHPNDLGFSRIAEKVGAILKRAVVDGKIK